MWTSSKIRTLGPETRRLSNRQFNKTTLIPLPKPIQDTILNLKKQKGNRHLEGNQETCLQKDLQTFVRSDTILIAWIAFFRVQSKFKPQTGESNLVPKSGSTV